MKKTYQTATAAIEPDRIKSTTPRPADFDKFWQTKIKEVLTKPLNSELALIPEYSNDSIDVFQVKYQISKKMVILRCPMSAQKNEKLPALIRFPGAGGVYPSRPEMEMAQQGIITLSVYIHDYPVTLEENFYNELSKSALKEYQYIGIENRNDFYYNRVIAGCVKAVEFIYSLPEFDKERLAVWGSSQGGALSIITASLERRVKRLAAFCPGMCDFTGYLHGRPGGAWPDFYNSSANIGKLQKEKVYKNVLPYYDVVNFAEKVKVPGFYSWGDSMIKLLPLLQSMLHITELKLPRKFLQSPQGEHKIYPEQIEKLNKWIYRILI